MAADYVLSLDEPAAPQAAVAAGSSSPPQEAASRPNAAIAATR